jgi:hypothetical protein
MMGKIELSEEKKERIVRSLMNRERLQPNIERSFLCFTKKTYHGRFPFIPTKTLLDQAKGKFS